MYIYINKLTLQILQRFCDDEQPQVRQKWAVSTNLGPNIAWQIALKAEGISLSFIFFNVLTSEKWIIDWVYGKEKTAVFKNCSSTGLTPLKKFFFFFVSIYYWKFFESSTCNKFFANKIISFDAAVIDSLFNTLLLSVFWIDSVSFDWINLSSSRKVNKIIHNLIERTFKNKIKIIKNFKHLLAKKKLHLVL